MKLSLFERAITCGLFGAAIFAVSTGMKRTDPPEESAIGVGRSEDESAEFKSPDDDREIEVAVRLERLNVPLDSALDKLIEAVKKASNEDKAEKRVALKNALSEIFRKKTEAQRTRIQEMKERIESIETQLAKRTKLEDQIVQRRLGELLGEKDELSWDDEPGISIDVRGKGEEAKLLLEKVHDFEVQKDFPLDKVRREFRTHATEDMLRDALVAEGKLGKDTVLLREFRLPDLKVPGKGALDSSLDIKEKEAKEAAIQAKRQHLRNLESKSFDLDEVRGKLELLGLNENQKEADMQSLKAQLEAMRAKSMMLQRQLDEVTKKNLGKKPDPVRSSN